jgi:hypothetical protein
LSRGTTEIVSTYASQETADEAVTVQNDQVWAPGNSSLCVSAPRTYSAIPQWLSRNME